MHEFSIITYDNPVAYNSSVTCKILRKSVDRDMLLINGDIHCKIYFCGPSPPRWNDWCMQAAYCGCFQRNWLFRNNGCIVLSSNIAAPEMDFDTSENFYLLFDCGVENILGLQILN